MYPNLQFYKLLEDDTLSQSLGVILLAVSETLKRSINWASDDITAAVGKVDSGAIKMQVLWLLCSF